jgi:hypothetical protein
MRGVVALALLVVVAGGCATTDWPFNSSSSLLARADRFADGQQYEAALRAYDEFLARYPSDRRGRAR